jgi:hypothetical protein
MTHEGETQASHNRRRRGLGRLSEYEHFLSAPRNPPVSPSRLHSYFFHDDTDTYNIGDRIYRWERSFDMIVYDNR